MTIWVISDWHLGHDNCCVKFKRRDGTPLRSFRNAEECDEHMIAVHNRLVKPQDHVYMLGDVCIRREHLRTVKRFNGHKRLVLGNHDIFRTREYLDAGFEEIHGCRVIDNLMLTHVPIHPDCLGRFRGNVHGHIHENVLPTEETRTLDRKRPYLNVGVEVLNYTPITLEEVIMRLRAGEVHQDLIEEVELLGD